MTDVYAVRLTADDNGTLLVACPDLPEVTSFGVDEADALAHARDAIEEALAARMADGRDIPEPQSRSGRRVRLPTLTTIKVALWRALKKEGITRAELQRRLGWHREQVDRLFRLDHATRMDQFDAAFAALGHRLSVRIDDAA